MAVTGGRDFNDMQVVHDALSTLPKDAILINGGARGADRLCLWWWADRGRQFETYRADWAQGRAAGPLRNQRMVDTGLDLLIAFPGGRGTADMVRRCRKAQVPIMFPPPPGWFPLGFHLRYRPLPDLEFSVEHDETGDPLWERPVS